VGVGRYIVADEPAAPPGLQVYETRLYFDPKTGNVISAHQLVSGADESLPPEQVEAELSEFQQSLRERHPDIDFITVDTEQLRTSEKGIKVDIETRSIVISENGLES
jgi:hypothetical protein